MTASGSHCDLFLNDKPVGRVVVRGGDTSWKYGNFQPSPEFHEFAPIFGRWSLLMHADDGSQLSEAASQELRAAEYDMDRVRARLFFPELGKWIKLAQLNIDGTLIEWKEY